MAASIQKPLIVHYLITCLLLGVLLFYGLKLHRYAKYSEQLVAVIRSFQDSAGTSHAYDSNFKGNIEKQLAMASSADMDWIAAFKKDSAAYPQNIAAHAFSSMPKFGVVLENMTLDKDTVVCLLIVRDKDPFHVTVKFIQQGNIFLLDNLDNIGALYKRLNCYNMYSKQTAKIENPE